MRGDRRVPAIVSAVLRLYPRGFRDRFGQELHGVLLDLAHEVADAPRPARCARWIRVLADLLVGALRERSGTLLGSVTVRRCCGVAATAGGALFLIAMIVPMRGPWRIGVPAAVLGMLAGAVGLYASLHGRRPPLERLGLALAGTGLMLGLIGMTGSAMGIIEPNPWAPVINTGEHLGLVLIGAGMLVWGLLALRTRALGRWSFSPVLIGICGLAGLSVLVPGLFPVLENGPVPLAFAAGWILTGIGLIGHPQPHTVIPGRR